MVADPTNEITGVRFCGEKLAYVNYKKDDEFVDAQSNVNVVIASYVTCQARLRLYEDIERLQECVLYFDTDSLIFVTRPQDVYMPKLGSFLGDWTDELADYGPGSYITEFVSGGPKNYAFKVLCPTTGKTETVTKIRGFTLNYANSQHLNFNTLRNMVKLFVRNGCKEHVRVYISRIERTANRKVVTRNTKKDYRIVYDKRVIRPDFTTVPFGF